MTEAAPEETGQPAAPQPEGAQEKEKATKPDEAKGFPVGQAAAGGLGAITLGSYALASVVGPLGWLAAPATAGVAGAGYVAYKRRKRGGAESTTKTTTTKTSGGRTGGGGLLGGGRGSGSQSGTATSSKRSGGLPAGGSSGKPGGGSGPAAGRGGTTPGSKPGSAAPRGGGGRGSAAPRRPDAASPPRGGSASRRTSGGDTTGQRRTGGSTPRGGTDSTTSKRKTTPPGGGTGSKPGTSPRTPGGRMSENRWGGTTGPTPTTRPGAVRRGAAKARDWADDKTGRRMSTGWRAARGQEGFKARRRAAGQAVRDAGGGGIIAAIVGVIAALFAGIASLFGRSGSGEDEKPAEKNASPTPGEEVPGHPGVFYADPQENRPGYVDRKGLGPDHPGYTTGSYDANSDPRSWEERVAAGDVPGFSPNTSTTNTGGATMSGLPAAQIAHDMAAAMARYEPNDAWAVVAESKQWPDVPTQTAMSVKAYADRLEGARFPLNPAIIDKLQELFQALAGARSIAEELYPLLQKAHAEDIAKQEAPRGDESKWNV